VRGLKTGQFPEDAGPLAHPVRPSRYIEINNFYTATVYSKGAEVVRMLQTLLGRDGFRKGMDLYFERHDGQACTVEDFVACFADASGRDLTQFMTWYSQAGTPEVACTLKYDAKSETAELTFTQSTPATPGEARKKPLHIPVKLGLIDADGRELDLVLASGERLADGLVELRKKSEKVRFRNVPSAPVVSLLRGFSAPVNLKMERSDAELAFLMANDSDLFNRWEAAQDYAARVLTQAVAARAAGERAPAPRAFIEALGATLRDQSVEPGYLAQFLMLPSEGDLARIIGGNVDPAAIHKARSGLRRAIATRLGDTFADIYGRMETPGPYSPDPEPAGRRSLRNVALGYLAARGQPADVARAARHFSGARNLTDESAALMTLAELNVPERDAALARFYERWKDDHLVIDAWFGCQARAPLASSLATVRRLTRHPLFSIKNPNKVRALIGAFAHGNPVNFNRPDGKGYDFVADRVLELDAFNPQIAARLLSAFRGWKMLEPVRRAAAERTLRRVAKAKPVSNDVFEIVSKMLE
jgi:aminopeptidase N